MVIITEVASGSVMLETPHCPLSGNLEIDRLADGTDGQ